jgi:hypothetical protein
LALRVIDVLQFVDEQIVQRVEFRHHSVSSLVSTSGWRSAERRRSRILR